LARQPSPAQHARKRPTRTVYLINLTLVGMAIGLLWLVGGQRIWRFVTGQDILDEVAVEAVGEAQTADGSPAFLPESEALAGQTDVVLERVADPYTDVPSRERRQVIRYQVQSGDTIFGLAEKFGLDPNTIFWANTDTLQDNVHLISIGLPLYILPDDGVYHTAMGKQSIADIAAEFGVTPESILDSPYNNLPSLDPAYAPPEGTRLVVEGGVREYISWSSPIIRTGAEEATSPESPSLHPGACRNFYTGTGGTGEFNNPLGIIPYKVTTGFFGWHPGVDFSAEPGTPVYAADGGVVVFAGHHTGGYGTLVILDHGNGFTSYYAHLNARYVECGQSVGKGITIGEVGATGIVSGAHLHFEVRKNHVPQSPYLYIEIFDVRTGT
jgi:murein DD-endopeptidase MepM/ murein hydrolase activator NlpD